MRFIADRNSLLRAFGHITGIVERRNTIPILSNISDRRRGLPACSR